MLKLLIDEIYGGSAAEFSAVGSPEEAARSLAQATPRCSLPRLFTNAVVGAVSVERVVLRRHRPFFSNSFAPMFRGRFTAESGHTALRGRFGLHPFVKGFTTLWFAFIAFFCLLTPFFGLRIAANDASPWWAGLVSGLGSALCGFLVGLAGFAILRVSKRLSRGDVAEISRHIAAALELTAA